jgi:TolA-binding protein
MAKKSFFTILILSALVVSLGTGVCFADALAQLEKFETYKWYPPQAEQIYQEIARDYPGSDYALTAHKNLVISYITAKRDNEAQQALDKLAADFAGHSGLPEALYEIAKRYEQSKEYEKAGQLYQQIVQKYPNSSSADKARIAGSRIGVLFYIELKKDDAADAALNSLIADFNDNPELPESIYDIARRYERAKKYEKAKGLYQQIVQQEPESSAAGRAKLAVKRADVMLLIESGEPNAVQTAIDGLIADYAGHQDLALSLYDIANKGYEREKKYQQAKDVYQRIMQLCPDSPEAGGAPLNIAKVQIFGLIEAGEYDEATGAIDRLIVDFSGHSGLPAIVYSIARAYERAGKYELAKKIYQQIAQQYQETSHADLSLLNVAKSQALIYLDAGDHDKALVAVDRLIADFNNHPHSCWAVSWIAARYYEKSRQLRLEGLDTEAKDHLIKAITIWKKAIQELPESTTTPAAYHLAGVCYQELGEYEKAIEYFEDTVNKWPTYKDASHAQYLVARCYEELEKAGRISTADAAVHITQACEKLLADYPTSMVATAGQRLLEKWSSKEN